MLKEEGVFGANLGNDSNEFMKRLKTDMTRIIEEEDFVLEEVISMKTSRSHLTNKKVSKNIYKLEPCFFYRKGAK